MCLKLFDASRLIVVDGFHRVFGVFRMIACVLTCRLRCFPGLLMHDVASVLDDAFVTLEQIVQAHLVPDSFVRIAKRRDAVQVTERQGR